MMNEMMGRMMNQCCGGEGKQNFGKMKEFMESCGCLSTITKEPESADEKSEGTNKENCSAKQC